MDSQNRDKPQTHNDFSKGTMVSHYRLIKKIGAGGMGEVYLAEDSKLKRQVALKFLFVDPINNSAIRQQFIKEAQAAARLQHPNIITVHEVNEYKGTPYISMAYIEGQTLGESLNLKTLSFEEIINIGIQIGSGLTAAHEKGITHRDLKPGNIMLDHSGTIKILDFGLATLSDTTTTNEIDSTVTSSPFANKIAGTILYMAPEQLIGQEISHLVDVFAFGVILYEMITSQHPFSADSASEISARILRDTPLKMTAKRENIPYDLNRIISRCLHKNPTKRFQSARDICNELEELSHQLNNEIDVSISYQGIGKSAPTLTEESFVLTTDLVRKLSTKEPKMIGTKLAYIDNKISSDELIIYLHGIGHDHRQFTDVLRQLPYRAIALSLYGFDKNAQLRLPIGLDDHSILLHAVIKNVCSSLKPKQVVLVGFSSGADHFLEILNSELFSDIKVKGMLALGCNLHLQNCFATSKYSELENGNEEQVLATIKLFSQNAASISDWLLFHDYLLIAFSKFGAEIQTLKKYSTDIIAPFNNGSWEQFPKWYKNSIKKILHTRIIFDTDSSEELDVIMQQHLDENVLGDDFHEDTIVRVPYSHMVLGQPEMVCKHTLDFMKLLSSK